jgi:hypothetical protein
VERSVVLSESNVSMIQLAEDGTVTLGARIDSPGAWELSNRTVDASGRPVALPSWFGSCLPPPAPPSSSKEAVGAASKEDLAACFDRLRGLGYRQQVVYQPDSHFWPLQWAETGLFAGLSALLAGVCFWWTRRRLS